MAPEEISLVEQYRMVKYWSYDEGWLWNELEGKLPVEVLDRISTVIFSENDENYDEVYWEACAAVSFRLSLLIAYLW